MNDNNEKELKEFNDFLQESPVRSQFLPILNHITKLKANDLKIDEYKDKQNNPVVTFQFKSCDGELIEGRTCFDWWADTNPSVKDDIIFEFWWCDECYRLTHTPNQAMNQITLFLKRGCNKPMYGFKTFEELKAFKKSNELIEL